MADEVRLYAEENCYNILNTRQGYSRCCACPVGENALISADRSILSAARSSGIDTLEISVGGVALREFDYGFIGGACGVLDDRIYFAGDIMSHPDGERIVTFCRKRGIEVVSLSDEGLTDVGSIFFL